MTSRFIQGPDVCGEHKNYFGNGFNNHGTWFGTGGSEVQSSLPDQFVQSDKHDFWSAASAEKTQDCKQRLTQLKVAKQ